MASQLVTKCVIFRNKQLFLLCPLVNSYLDLSMKKSAITNSVEPEKIIAERINGWAAMMGFWAAIGAYLTTGQIIPGVI